MIMEPTRNGLFLMQEVYMRRCPCRHMCGIHTQLPDQEALKAVRPGKLLLTTCPATASGWWPRMTMPGMFPSMGSWSQPATSSIREDGAHQATMETRTYASGWNAGIALPAGHADLVFWLIVFRYFIYKISPRKVLKIKSIINSKEHQIRYIQMFRCV